MSGIVLSCRAGGIGTTAALGMDRAPATANTPNLRGYSSNLYSKDTCFYYDTQ